MPFPGNTVTFTNDLSLLSRLLGHPVVSLERERAPMMDLERITKVVLAPDRAIPLPPNNVLRNLGEVAELRALLEGWSRQAAEMLKERVEPDSRPPRKPSRQKCRLPPKGYRPGIADYEPLKTPLGMPVGHGKIAVGGIPLPRGRRGTT